MAQPKKKEEDKYVKMSVSFDPDTLKRIEKYCQDEERSVSWVIRKSVNYWLDNKK